MQVLKGQWNENAEQKMAEQKFGWDPQGAQVQVQKGQWNKKWWNKNLVGTLRDSKCKYRKVSRTKNGGTKMLVGTLRP